MSEQGLSAEYTQYSALFDEKGPQIESLSQEDYLAAKQDSRSLFDSQNSMPVLTPVDLLGWHSSGFFENTCSGEQDFRNATYYALPTGVRSVPPEVVGSFNDLIVELATKNSLLLVDEYVPVGIPGKSMTGGRVHQLQESLAALSIDLEPITIWQDRRGRKYPYATVQHFAVDINVTDSGLVSEAVKVDQEDVFHLKGPEVARLNLDELYGIYTKQFTPLALQHVVNGVLPQDEFMDVMEDDDSTSFFYSQGSEITAFATVSSNIGGLPWLNEQDFIDRHPEAYKNDKLVYSPHIVSKVDDNGKTKGNGGAALALSVGRWCAQTSLPSESSRQTDKKGTVLRFECSDISARYIEMAFSTRQFRKIPGITAETSRVGFQQYMLGRLVRQEISP